ncbi:ComGF family competence protein [Staphylococcus lutrae]|nr:ComGF family competence protein [Staphylococcus lutrae]
MLIPIIIVTLGQLKNTIFEDRTFDIEIMVKDMENVIHANDVKQQMISNKTMMIQRDNVLVNYRFQNKKIIKTINHHGNITMLNNVQDVHYQEIDHHMILMTIKYKEGAILHVKEVLL